MFSNNSSPTDFQSYMAELKRINEQKRLAKLQQQYPATPDYTNMSLQDELLARFDIDEMEQLQKKHGTLAQTPVPPMQTATPVPPTSYMPIYSLQPMGGNITNKTTPSVSPVDYGKYGDGFSKEMIDEMLADTNFHQAMNTYVLPNEGGYNNDYADRGGKTNFGITERWYPGEDIENMTKERAQAIYYRDYWLKTKINQLPDELSDIVLDNSVIQGQSQAVKNLQRALGVSVDGILGTQTLKAVRNANDYNEIRQKIKQNANDIEDKYQTKFPDQKKFNKGHRRRYNSY